MAAAAAHPPLPPLPSSPLPELLRRRTFAAVVAAAEPEAASS
eukprot:CAMPEP_0178648806 /NCGR_PEP_ID=MMETSP0698-20121128/20664_1 /TAXON_ID=265572 /ORGANISM="Extubocellulus spinifer, Strain CCMP396" /LENGTH=41 /DNA_ID= /DNA_START= /DNA_END= /DNA_ORIENTATION=